MSSVKRILGDYTITSVDTGNVTFNTDTVIINGNLDVNGGITYIDTTELNIFDPFISLNNSNTASFSSNGGVLVHKTSDDYAGIRYNNTDAQWEVSVSTGNTGTTGTWLPLATAGTATGNVSTGSATQLAYYQSNGSTVVETTANLTWVGNSVLTVIGNVKSTNYLVDNTLYLKTTSSSVASLDGNIVVAAANASQGGTGLYINNTSATDELVSKTKARKFAILFG